jgi:hypothetical protein
MRTPSTISEATANNIRPPAMWNAGSEMPSVASSQSPISAVPASTAAAIVQARTAICRRAARGRPSVTARNVGVRPIGSTTTSSVTRAETR